MARPKKVKEEKVSNYASPLEQYFVESGEAVKSKFGEDMVSSAVDEDSNISYLYVPDLGMQWTLGRVGFGLGRIMQVMGYESAGKTSFALWVADLCIRAGGIAAMIETEQAASSEHALAYLSQPEYFRIFHPETVESAMEMTIDQLNYFLKIDPEGKIPKVLLYDSLAGSTDERAQDDENNFKQGKVGGSAKVIKDATNIIKCKLKEANCLWIVLNQGRDLIQTGFAARMPEADKLIGSGGRAIPFAATYWAVIKKNAATKSSSGDDAGEKDGFKSKLTWRKNKLRTPFREINYNVRWGQSFDFTENTTKMLALGEICGFQEIKGGKFFSDEAGIPKDKALSAEEFYAYAHHPDNICAFQEELDIITTDKILTYTPPQKSVIEVKKVDEPELTPVSFDATNT